MNERTQVVGIVLAVLVILAAAWFFVLLPGQRERRGLEAEIERMRGELAAGNALMDELPLQNRKNALRQAGLKRRESWEKAALELSTFEQHQIIRSVDASKIDFKVTLFDVRERLSRKAAEHGIRPTYELAIDEKVLSNEDARKRMLQLRAAERIMDLTLGLKVNRVEAVEPLEPVMHRDEATGELFLEEYPVRIQYVGTIENVYAFFHEIFQPARVFAVRRMKLEKESLQSPDRVRADATVSALVFLRNLEEMRAPVTAPTFMKPLGF